MKKYEPCINLLYILQMQFDQMASCIKMLDSVMLSQRYRKHRPSVSIRQDPRAWWKYAYTCIAVTRQTWSTMLQRAKVLIWRWCNWCSNKKGSWQKIICTVQGSRELSTITLWCFSQYKNSHKNGTCSPSCLLGVLKSWKWEIYLL